MKGKKDASVREKPRVTWQRFASVFSSLLLTAAILFCLLVIFQVKRQGYVSIFGYSVYRVVTESMEPTVSKGALILTRKTDIENISERDIICFYSLESYMYGSIIAHRVIQVDREDGEIILHTRGDANNSEDGFYVTDENLIGKVISYTGKQSLITKIYSILTTKMGFFTFILIPIMLIVVFIVRDNLKKVREEIAAMKEEAAEQGETSLQANELSAEEYAELESRIRAELLAEFEQENELSGEEGTEPSVESPHPEIEIKTKSDAESDLSCSQESEL